MNRIPPVTYAAFLILIVVIWGGVGFAKAGLYLGYHEGDAAHMAEIVLRIIEGQRPHLDFSTPIGFLAFYPIVWMTGLTGGIGQGFVLSQVLIAALLAPMVFHVAMSRLSGFPAYLYGFITLTMIVALGHGEDIQALSASMYYNRWAWAAAFVVIPLAIFKAHSGEAVVLDGVIIGLLMAALALIKPTYFVAFALPVSIALLSRQAYRTLVVGLFIGMLCAFGAIVLFGDQFYPAYIADLYSVANSENRAAPGLPLIEVVNGQRHLIATLLLLAAVVTLRQGGRMRDGLALLLFAPGFIYVTYQNYGNDPKWLLLVAVLLVANGRDSRRPVSFGIEAGTAYISLAMLCMVATFPSFQNIITSPFRHIAEDGSQYRIHIPQRPEMHDVFVQEERASSIFAQYDMAEQIPVLSNYTVETEGLEPITFLGEEIPFCTLKLGDASLHSYMAEALKKPPFNFTEDMQLFMPDIASGVWMMGGFEPLKGGAPWYYSGAPGFENADALVIPLCPIAPEITQRALEVVETLNPKLSAPLWDETMLVYRVLD